MCSSVKSCFDVLFYVVVVITTSSCQDRNDDKILIEAFLDSVKTDHNYKSLVEEKLVNHSDEELERLSVNNLRNVIVYPS